MKLISMGRRRDTRPTISQLTAYLTRTGWTRYDDGNPNAMVFHGQNDIYGKPIELIVPARPDLIDADRRMDDALRALSTYEDVSKDEIEHKVKIMVRRGRTRRLIARGERQSVASINIAGPD